MAHSRACDGLIHSFIPFRHCTVQLAVHVPQRHNVIACLVDLCGPTDRLQSHGGTFHLGVAQGTACGSLYGGAVVSRME